MGASDGEDGIPACTGQDVIDQLNHAFGTISSQIYHNAQSGNVFSGVRTGADLVTAYTNAGMSVSANWARHLTSLSDVNAEAIADARSIALNQGIPTITGTHKYAHASHHNVTITVSDTLVIISSPFRNTLS